MEQQPHTEFALRRYLVDDPSGDSSNSAYDLLLATRPTAVNLRWTLDDMIEKLFPLPEKERSQAAFKRAAEICDKNVIINSNIGNHGLKIIKNIWERNERRKPVNILTHCNAGWIATDEWGTALSPIYKAHDTIISVHVCVDETRPRNQRVSLTA